MKKSRILAVVFLIPLLNLFPLLRGGELKNAEELFMQGKWEECRRILAVLLNDDNIKKLPEAERTKAAAMQEYIIGSNPELIAESLKLAREIAAHPGWLTDDLLNHATLLIRRAADWKDRGIIEYQELCAAAGKLLGQARDNGDPDTALKILMLQVRNHNLDGEYNEPLKKIIQTLHFYYPPAKMNIRRIPPGAARLMTLAGDQYMGLGIRSNSEREKKDAFSQAAKYYTWSLAGTPFSDPQFQYLSNQLHYCAETLKLLGFQLNLPRNIRPRSATDVAMIDEMLKHRRYQDVILATETHAAPAMRIRCAAALAGIGDFNKAVETACAQGVDPADAPVLLNIARTCLAGGRKDEALVLLRHYLTYAADNPDAEAALSECASLLLDAGQYQEAADRFLEYSKRTKDPDKQSRAVLAAAQSCYKAGNYPKTIELLRPRPFQPDNALLIVHALIHLEKYNDALTELKKILVLKNLTEAQQKTTLQLAIACLNGNAPEEEITYCRQILTQFPDDADSFKYAKRLLELYPGSQNINSEDYRKLGEWAIENHLEHGETVALVLRAGEWIPNASGRDSFYDKLLKRQDFSPADLASLLTYFHSTELKLKFLKRYRKPFANTPDICELYYQIASLEAIRGNRAEALKHCENILSQKPVYEYVKVKMLYAELLNAAGKNEAARRAWQELLQTRLQPGEIQQTVLNLSTSWEQSGEHKKAIATAWTAVPLDGKITPEAKENIRSLLQLIIRNAQKIPSDTDRQDAEELLKNL
jgi:predicted Zn-dependent protease